MDEKVAIVTGAAQGIGKAISEALLDKGAQVVLVDVNTEKVQLACNEFRTKFKAEHVLFRKCDVTSEDEMEALFKYVKDECGRVDIVVNNAGICHEGTWELMIDINIKGVVRGMQLAIEYMSKDRGGNGGTIINLCSAAGVHPTPFLPAYAATKHAILAYTRSICQHPSFATTGVRVNCLCPFAVETEMLGYDESMVHGLEMARAANKFTGVLEVQDIVRVFMRVCTGEEYNGNAFLISTKGVRIVPQQFKNFNDMTAESVFE